MKLAAMEALYEGGRGEALTGVALVNPFAQPDYTKETEPPMKIAVPKVLSFLATRDFNGYVPGIRNIINGYTKDDGTVELPLKEKIIRGKQAIEALKAYRGGQKTDANIKTLKENMKYFGYGYIKNADQTVPPIGINFWAFRFMVGLGALFILVFAIILFVLYRKDISRPRLLQIVGVALIPLAYIASECGWLVAEFGRQPWTIQDMLPTWAAVSDLNSGSVALTFFLFLFLFTAMLLVEISIMCKQIKKGPQL
jgi:putative cytochrome bd-II oxidase subunit 1